MELRLYVFKLKTTRFDAYHDVIYVTTFHPAGVDRRTLIEYNLMKDNTIGLKFRVIKDIPKGTDAPLIIRFEGKVIT